MFKTRDSFIPGQEFGNLICVKRVEADPNGRQQWLFKCKVCGKEYIKRAQCFTGNGALYKRTHANMCKPDLIEVGSKIDDLIVLERVENRKHMQRYRVKCSICNREKVVYVESLQKHSGTSHADCVYAKDVKYIKIFHESWQNMRNRTNPKVNNPKNKCYINEGIKSDAFKYFIDFYDYAYKDYTEHVEKYGQHNTTLDRIDSTKDYEPGNIRWATRLEQAQNTSVLRKVKVTKPDGTIILENSVTNAVKNHSISLSSVYNCLNKKKDSVKNYKFEYC